MQSPHAAIAWQLWRPYRWWLAAAVGWFVVVMIACLVMPKGRVFDVAAWYLVSPLAMMALGTLTVFSYSNSVELTARESGFPTRMLTLPVTARTLAGWPMLYGSLTVATFWLAVAALILLPRGIEVPIWWPALFAAGFLAWFQVICWSAFAWTWLRMAGAVALLAVYVGTFVLGAVREVPEWLLSAAIAIQLPVAFALAVRAVARTRQGDIPERIAFADRGCDRSAPESWHQRFASASRAQDWFEWRLNGWSLAVTTCIFLGMYTVGLCVMVFFGRVDSTKATGALVVLMLQTPVLLAMSFAPVLGRFHNDRRPNEMPLFLATRPVGVRLFVAAKFRIAAKSTLITAAITLVGYAILAIPAGFWNASVRWWNALTAAYSPFEAALIAALALVAVLVVTWGLGVQSMWLVMTGRQWPIVTVGVLLLPLFFGSLMGYLWLTAHPEQMRLATNLAPRAAVVVAAGKLALAGWLVRVLLRRRLVDVGVVMRVGAVWLAAFAAFSAAACWLVPAASAPWYATVSCVVLLLPTLGIELAPLALAWNRHR